MDIQKKINEANNFIYSVFPKPIRDHVWYDYINDVKNGEAEAYANMLELLKELQAAEKLTNDQSND